MSAELVKYLSGFINPDKLEKFNKILNFRTRYINVICEEIFQSHNASAIMRSCDCFGIQDIHIIEERNSFEVNSEVALGASRWISLNRYNISEGNSYSVYSKLRSEGYRIIATTPLRHGESLAEFNLEKGPVSLIFGTEKDGISNSAIQEADGFLSIDMYGFTESLNVSVSAGIILFNLRLLLQKSDIEWQLKEQEKILLKLDWLRKTIKRCDLLEAEFGRRNKR